MKRPISDRAAAIGLASLTLGLFYGRLLSPDLAIIARDLPFLHLPLRTAFVQLADGGLPSWNPWVHGGQPILSNPHYAAFYPPTWLQFIVPLPYAVNLIILIHAAIAFAGAWKLARAFAGGRSAAALASVGLVAGGAMLSLPSLLNLFCAAAWLPWVLALGLRGLRDPEARTARLLAAVAWAFQLLAGSPAAAIASGVALGVVAIPEVARSRRALPRLATIGVLALLLAAVQWLPTLERLRDTARAGGLTGEEATTWSASPLRLLELAAPHLYGDPARDEEELYFGWTLHDKGYPLVLSIYPGMLLLVLALSLALRRRRRPVAGLALLAAGLFLALGRFNPLYGLVTALVPPIGMVRYPEKFLLLVTVSLVLLGAAGWASTLRDRERNGTHRRNLTVAIALLAATAGWTALCWAAPQWVTTAFVQPLIGTQSSPTLTANAAGYLRAEGLAMTLTAAAIVGLLLLARSQRVSGRSLTILALALLAADLWHAGHRLNPIGPASWYRDPPAATLDPAERLFSDAAFFSGPQIGLRAAAAGATADRPPGLDQMRAKLDRLDPYSANLWGAAYALNEDYDLLLTGWGRHANRLLDEAWPTPGLAAPYLSAWGVGAVATRKSPRELAAEYRASGGRLPSAAKIVPHPALPRYRFVARARLSPSLEAAVSAARAGGYRLADEESLVQAEGVGLHEFDAAARIDSVQDGGDRIAVAYSSASTALLVVASTFDRGWSATLAGDSVEILPTAIGQMALVVPPGGGVVQLEHRDPRVGVGLAVTSLTLLLVALREVRRRKLEGTGGTASESGPAVDGGHGSLPESE